MKKTILLSLLTCFLSISVSATSPEELANLGCTAEILVEPSSGKIISEVNSDKALPPASMVKTMTAYVTYKQIKQGFLNWDDIITTSAFASKVGGSQVYLSEKEQFTVKQLIHALMIQSANDAAVAIAEHIGGSQDGFVELMNAEAKRLGMNDSEFHSAHGLPPAQGQLPDLISPRDMAKLARALITEFPEVLEVTSTLEEGFRDGKFIMRTHNHLLKNFPGCDGLKTGYYGKAGFCVTATAVRNNIRMLAVVMGCRTSKERDAEAAKLLATGIAKYRNIQLINQGDAIEAKVPVINAEEREITPITKEAINAIVPITEVDNIQKEITPCKELTAPITKGTTCGELTVSLNGEIIGKTDLIVNQDLAELGFMKKVLRKFGF